MAIHATVTIRVPVGNRLPRWNWPRCIRVTASVRTVKTNTAGTAIRALAHSACRPASASMATLAQ